MAQWLAPLRAYPSVHPEEGGRRKEEGGGRREKGGGRKEEGGGRREEGGGRKKEGLKGGGGGHSIMKVKGREL